MNGRWSQATRVLTDEYHGSCDVTKQWPPHHYIRGTVIHTKHRSTITITTTTSPLLKIITMKVFVILCVVGVSVAQQIAAGTGTAATATATATAPAGPQLPAVCLGNGLGGVQGGLVGQQAALGGVQTQPINWGPKVYGRGANNINAIPPQIFQMCNALRFVNSRPNVLIRLDLNGKIEVTDQFGEEYEQRDQFGREIDVEFF
ncbi:hypothetical protein Pmani_031325 [Petrolisthes manimaculis]|uniref:Uncharacterized protein n=1 Tax=Petrolisthes manimaculis TaxID=1843537 RepID=A0AAE1TV03_9EUCA|nr:hypothetical protein Pmani_031325 [Petrolisthes manimaculis]